MMGREDAAGIRSPEDVHDDGATTPSIAIGCQIAGINGFRDLMGFEEPISFRASMVVTIDYDINMDNRMMDLLEMTKVDDWVLYRVYNKKNDYKKIVQHAKETPHKETMDSFEVIEDI